MGVHSFANSWCGFAFCVGGCVLAAHPHQHHHQQQQAKNPGTGWLSNATATSGRRLEDLADLDGADMDFDFAFDFDSGFGEDEDASEAGGYGRRLLAGLGPRGGWGEATRFGFGVASGCLTFFVAGMGAEAVVASARFFCF